MEPENVLVLQCYQGLKEDFAQCGGVIVVSDSESVASSRNLYPCCYFKAERFSLAMCCLSRVSVRHAKLHALLVCCTVHGLIVGRTIEISFLKKSRVFELEWRMSRASSWYVLLPQQSRRTLRMRLCRRRTKFGSGRFQPSKRLQNSHAIKCRLVELLLEHNGSFQAIYASEKESEDEAFQQIRDFKSVKKKVLQQPKL